MWQSIFALLLLWSPWLLKKIGVSESTMSKFYDFATAYNLDHSLDSAKGKNSMKDQWEEKNPKP